MPAHVSSLASVHTCMFALTSHARTYMSGLAEFLHFVLARLHACHGTLGFAPWCDVMQSSSAQPATPLPLISHLLAVRDARAWGHRAGLSSSECALLNSHMLAVCRSVQPEPTKLRPNPKPRFKHRTCPQVPYILPIFVPLGLAFLWVRRRYVAASREIKRWVGAVHGRMR